MAEDFFISGIQQVGIGNPDMAETWRWYRQHFGFDVPVFEEEATAELMLPYTGGQPQKRRATLALNMNGGGGLEIWQYTERELIWLDEPAQPGDYGIHTLKIKTRDLTAAKKDLLAKGLKIAGEQKAADGQPAALFIRDLHQNLVELTEFPYWFKENGGLYGGVAGAALGVSDLERSAKFYAELLGFDKTVARFSSDGKAWGGSGDEKFERVVLARSRAYQGAFAPLLGPAWIELVQKHGTGKKLYENRFWGDPGFIHLCFDVSGMDALQQRSQAMGHPFTVDSADSFDMGEAAGRFAYIEDPDGTLIEFVETHKVPILKKFNWYLNLRKRKPGKSLPLWMIKALGFSRVKD